MFTVNNEAGVNSSGFFVLDKCDVIMSCVATISQDATNKQKLKFRFIPLRNKNKLTTVTNAVSFNHLVEPIIGAFGKQDTPQRPRFVIMY